MWIDRLTHLRRDEEGLTQGHQWHLHHLRLKLLRRHASALQAQEGTTRDQDPVPDLEVEKGQSVEVTVKGQRISRKTRTDGVGRKRARESRALTVNGGAC